MDKTPCQYILWRFAGNDDRESLENQTNSTAVWIDGRMIDGRLALL